MHVFEPAPRMRTLLAIVWFGLAVWFLFGSRTGQAEVLGPIPRTPEFDTAQLTRGGMRVPLGDPPRVVIGGVKQKCSDCHALFASLDVTPSQIRQHTHIALSHGRNDRCYNCHSQGDRNKLILRDGAEVGFDRAPELCAQCHGTVHRDWERGMHGKTLGSWDARSGEQRRLLCIECHDPHAPAFGDFTTLPGPNTWRMGHPSTERDDAQQQRNPLERWKDLREGNARKEAQR